MLALGAELPPFHKKRKALAHKTCGFQVLRTYTQHDGHRFHRFGLFALTLCIFLAAGNPGNVLGQYKKTMPTAADIDKTKSLSLAPDTINDMFGEALQAVRMNELPPSMLVARPCAWLEPPL